MISGGVSRATSTRGNHRTRAGKPSSHSGFAGAALQYKIAPPIWARPDSLRIPTGTIGDRWARSDSDVCPESLLT